jgi:hypothetical protein
MQRLQSHSMDLFVEEPCVHLVIIESSEWNAEQWHQYLSPFYTKHTLFVIDSMRVKKEFRKYKPQSRRGWIKQQIFKLLASKYVRNNSYLILDSKNFFIRPTDLSKWPIREGNGMLANPYTLSNGRWTSWIDYTKQLTDKEEIATCAPPVTPFMCKTTTVRKMLKALKSGPGIDEAFFNFDESPSEFLMYSCFAAKPLKAMAPPRRPSVTLWQHDDPPDVERLKKIYKNKNVKILAVHKGCLKKIDPTEKRIFRYFERHGFDFDIVRSAFMSKLS